MHPQLNYTSLVYTFIQSHIRPRILDTELATATTFLYLEEGVNNVVGLNNESRSQLVYSLYTKAVYCCRHFFLMDRVFLFNIIELLTLKSNRMSFLYQHSPNSPIRSIDMHFEWPIKIRQP